jgi:hypothetical protein
VRALTSTSFSTIRSFCHTPKTQGYALDINPDGYETDGSRTLKIVFENVGEIDFICAPNLTDKATIKAEVRGRGVLLETPAEIIAKKIYYRGAAMQPRDMFDIASVARAHGLEYLNNALTPFRGKCESALKVARQMNPQFAESIMASLLHRNGFSDIPRMAQTMTIKVLETVCASAKT